MMRPTTVKLLIFTLVMAVIFAGLAMVFSQVRFSGSNGFPRRLLRRLGTEVRRQGPYRRCSGGVGHRGRIGDSNQAEIEFDVDTKYSLITSTRATVRYENLVGDRYMELLEGAGSSVDVSAGRIHSGRADAPALDLDLLLGGFKPLLQGARSQQVNDLSGRAAASIPGPGRNAGLACWATPIRSPTRSRTATS